MYWIYLTIFILAVLAPEYIRNGFLLLPEEDFESVLILLLGMVGFIIYLTREKELLRVFKDRLHLQKQANIITRDLSDSYSYIGEMNRKFDIVKELIFRLPKETTSSLLNHQADMYQPVIEAARLLTKTEPIALRIVNVKTKEIEKRLDAGEHRCFKSFTAERLLGAHKMFWEEEDCAIIRSPRQACDVTVFLIFPKTTNRVEDVEIFKILASEALFLYCVEMSARQGLMSDK